MKKIEMVLVEGGTFLMGSDNGYSREMPVHEVTLSDFYIGKYTVTQREWTEVMGSNPSCLKGDDLPVKNVSWNDIQEFISKLNVRTDKTYRLPTEAEWEFAARGGIKCRGYEYAGSNDVDEVAWCYINSEYETHPVGQKKANELGLYDMSGNVHEWCEDWYDTYSSTEQTNPKGPLEAAARVVRGGSWLNNPDGCRVANRSYLAPDLHYGLVGFRLAMSI